MEWHKSWVDAGLNSTGTVHMGEKILRKYVEAMRSIQDVLTSSLSQYDLHAMSFGILLLSLVSLSLKLTCRTAFTNCRLSFRKFQFYLSNKFDSHLCI